MGRLEQWFRNLGRRRKLNLVVGLVCGLVLVAACMALFVFQDIHSRREMRR